MKRNFFVAVIFGIFSLCLITSADAIIFLDFDSPNFSPDATPGNQSHVFSTAYGDIAFNGRIWNKINSDPYPDHTTDSFDGYFLKNTHDSDGYVVTMTFGFDVMAIDLYWLGQDGSRMHGAAYDIYGNELGSGHDRGTGEWEYQDIGGFSSPIRSIAFWTTRWNGSLVGNRMAVDDITVTPTPEPATILLMGAGLSALLLSRRRMVKK